MELPPELVRNAPRNHAPRNDPGGHALPHQASFNLCARIFFVEGGAPVALPDGADETADEVPHLCHICSGVYWSDPPGHQRRGASRRFRSTPAAADQSFTVVRPRHAHPLRQERPVEERPTSFAPRGARGPETE